MYTLKRVQAIFIAGLLVSTWPILALTWPFSSKTPEEKEQARVKKIIAAERKSQSKFSREQIEEWRKKMPHLLHPERFTYLSEKIVKLGKDSADAAKFSTVFINKQEEQNFIETIKKVNDSYPMTFVRTIDIILYQIETSLKALKDAEVLLGSENVETQAAGVHKFWVTLASLASRKIIPLQPSRPTEDIASDLTTKESAIYNAALYIAKQAGKKVMYATPLNTKAWLEMMTSEDAAFIGMSGAVLFGPLTYLATGAHDIVKSGVAALSDDEKLLLEAVQGLDDFMIRLGDLIEFRKKQPVSKDLLVAHQFVKAMERLIGTAPKIEKTGIIMKEDRLMPGSEDKLSILARMTKKFYTLSKANARDMFNYICILLYQIQQSKGYKDLEVPPSTP